jgi:hypothetical protein
MNHLLGISGIVLDSISKQLIEYSTVSLILTEISAYINGNLYSGIIRYRQAEADEGCEIVNGFPYRVRI